MITIIKEKESNCIRYGYYEGRVFIKHREGGPALIFFDGYEEWYRHGNLHREDGPATQFRNKKSWYIDGIECKSERQFYLELRKFKLSLLCK
jgi:hypothetical protein